MKGSMTVYFIEQAKYACTCSILSYMINTKHFSCINWFLKSDMFLQEYIPVHDQVAPKQSWNIEGNQNGSL